MFFKMNNHKTNNYKTNTIIKKQTDEKINYEDRFLDKNNEYNLYVDHLQKSNFKLDNEIAQKISLQKYVEDRIKYYLGDMYDKHIVYILV